MHTFWIWVTQESLVLIAVILGILMAIISIIFLIVVVQISVIIYRRDLQLRLRRYDPENVWHPYKKATGKLAMYFCSTLRGHLRLMLSEGS